MVVSVDEDKEVLYMTDTDFIDFPYILEKEKDEKEKLAREYLEKQVVDSGWHNSTYDEFFNALDDGSFQIIAHIKQCC